jgi:hypothetical protein
MKHMRRLLLLLVLAGSMAVVPAGSAHACSCVSARPAQFVEWADAVVWAEVRDVQTPLTGNGNARYLLDVQRVYKGEVSGRARVDSAAEGSACGLEGIEAGQHYAFFLAAADDDRWSADLCGGSGFGVDRATLERVAGPGSPARPGGDDGLPVSAHSYAGMTFAGVAAALTAVVLWRRRPGSGAA